MPLARMGGVGDAIGPDQWFRSLPYITRLWFGATLAITVAGNMGIFAPGQLAFYWPAIRHKFELWRFATCFCYAGPFSFNTLIALFMLQQFSHKYEGGGPFNTGAGGGTADYAFALLFAAVLMLVTYPVLMVYFPLRPFFASNMVDFVMYIWSKRHPTEQANIWGIPVPANYLPFAYLALSVLMGNSYVEFLHGIAIGHIYYFLVDVFPQVQGKDVLHTPQFLIDYFGIGEYRPDPVRVQVPQPNQEQQQRAAGGGGHNWGGGRQLGRE